MDISNAFDSVKRKYTPLHLNIVGFDFKFIKLVEACISTPSFAVLANGNPTQKFKSSCGLRQRDPYSPVLFSITKEGLSILLDYI